MRLASRVGERLRYLSGTCRWDVRPVRFSMTRVCSETETREGDGTLGQRRLRPTLESAKVGGETVSALKPGSAPTTDVATAGVATDGRMHQTPR
eukprot:8223792-Pyramimonas_sp.AAC.1